MTCVHVLDKEANSIGGGAVYTAELCRQLAGRGHEVTLICFAADPKLSDYVSVRVLPRSRLAELPVVWRMSPVWQLLSAWKHIYALRLQPADVVVGSAPQFIWAYHRCHPKSSWLYLPHALIAPVELASYTYGSWIQKHIAVSMYYNLERWALRGAINTVRFTKTGCDALEAHYGHSVCNSFVVFPQPTQISPEENKLTTVPPRLLFVGRLVKTKNFDMLIRFLTPLLHIPWFLDVVGDGEEYERLKAEAAYAGLGDRIVFHGHQEDVTPWYRSAYLLLQPSLLESAGLVVLEAMSHGVPVLAMRADGRRYLNANHELIDNNNDGYLAEDEEAFAEKLAYLLKNPELVRLSGNHARKTIRRRHRWSDHIDQFENLFLEVKNKQSS